MGIYQNLEVIFEEDDDSDYRKNHDRIRQMPIFLKAQNISELVRHLAKSVENTDFKFNQDGEKEMLENTLSFMRQNAYIIPAKISGAEAVEIYDLKMENAAIIRKAARELITDARGIQMHGFKDIEYLDLLRNEVEEFRILFAEWVKTFDPWNYIIDRWGLFNPPGINHDDKDLDDDIPFDPSDFFDEDFDVDDEENDDQI